MSKADAQPRSHGGVYTNQVTLEQLQKEYRMLEFNRKAYAEESQEILRKQQTCIGMLMKENASLKAKQMLETRQLNVSTFHQEASSQIERCEELSEEASYYASIAEHERLAAKKMEEEADLLKSKLLRARRLLGGINAASENNQMIEKQIRNLENRLEKASTKFNESLNRNRNLRTSIEGLQREKATFNNMNHKLEKDINMKKKEIAATIERSNAAYEQRDRFQSEIAGIEKNGQHERSDFAKQMTILNTELKQAFMDVSKSKNVSPIPFDGIPHSFAAALENDDPSSSSASKQLTVKGGGSSNSNINEGRDTLLTECVQQFMEALGKKSGGEEDVNDGVDEGDVEQEGLSTFKEKEDQNFRLFNHVIEQQNEIEILENQVQSLHDEEKHYTHKVGAGREQNRQTMENLDSRIQSIQAAVSKHMLLCTGIEKELHKVGNQTVNITAKFSRMDDDDYCPVPSLLTVSNENITEANITADLAFIEEKVITLLQQYKIINAEEAAEVLSSSAEAGMVTTTSKTIESGATPSAYAVALGVGPHTTTMGQNILHIIPPKLEDYSSGEEESNNQTGEDKPIKPLTYVELRDKASIVNARQRGRRRETSVRFRRTRQQEQQPRKL